MYFDRLLVILLYSINFDDISYPKVYTADIPGIVNYNMNMISPSRDPIIILLLSGKIDSTTHKWHYNHEYVLQQ